MYSHSLPKPGGQAIGAGGGMGGGGAWSAAVLHSSSIASKPDDKDVSPAGGCKSARQCALFALACIPNERSIPTSVVASESGCAASASEADGRESCRYQQ